MPAHVQKWLQYVLVQKASATLAKKMGKAVSIVVKKKKKKINIMNDKIHNFERLSVLLEHFLQIFMIFWNKWDTAVMVGMSVNEWNYLLERGNTD